MWCASVRGQGDWPVPLQERIGGEAKFASVMAVPGIVLMMCADVKCRHIVDEMLEKENSFIANLTVIIEVGCDDDDDNNNHDDDDDNNNNNNDDAYDLLACLCA